MRAFGRTVETATLMRGGPVALDSLQPDRFPSIDPKSLVNAQEVFMFQQGAGHSPPVLPIITKNASGGCVPICAAEISAGRVVRWVYMVHAHGGNNPLDVTAWTDSPQNIYVCMLVYNGEASLWGAQNLQDSYFEAMDPNNLIPDANVTLIYGNHTSLVITQKAMVAVEIS